MNEHCNTTQDADFQKWLAWAKVNTALFAVFTTDNGVTWHYQSDPLIVARETWQAAIEHAKKTMCNRN